jgi:hypothetical protein
MRRVLAIVSVVLFLLVLGQPFAMAMVSGDRVATNCVCC